MSERDGSSVRCCPLLTPYISWGLSALLITCCPGGQGMWCAMVIEGGRTEAVHVLTIAGVAVLSTALKHDKKVLPFDSAYWSSVRKLQSRGLIAWLNSETHLILGEWLGEECGCIGWCSVWCWRGLQAGSGLPWLARRFMPFRGENGSWPLESISSISVK